MEENADPTRPTILWIHGYCQCRLSWDNQFENEELASRFHCDYIRHYGQDNLGGLIFVAAATEMGRDEANALLGAEFLQLVPGFFSTDYATGSAALQQFLGMATYEELDPHTFYSLVGFNSVTLPVWRLPSSSTGMSLHFCSVFTAKECLACGLSKRTFSSETSLAGRRRVSYVVRMLCLVPSAILPEGTNHEA